jgi:hypothetical protein
MYNNLSKGMTNKVLKGALEGAFGAGGYAVPLLYGVDSALAQEKVANKKLAGLPAAAEAQLKGEKLRAAADVERRQIDPDSNNIYRARWDAMRTGLGQDNTGLIARRVFDGPLGQQVLKDLEGMTAGAMREKYNDKVVIERAIQMVQSGVLTIDQATVNVTSMYRSVAGYNNFINKYEAVGLLPQDGYFTTLGSGPAISSLGAHIRAFPFLGDAEAIRKAGGAKVENLTAGTEKKTVPGLDLTDPASVRRLLLGEMIADRIVSTVSSGKNLPDFRAGNAPFRGADDQVPTTTPEKP